MRIFVAGGAGVIGRQLVPLLAAAGHQVTATTRDPGRCAQLRALGAEPVILDGLDGPAVGEAVARAAPEVVIHQMTALAGVRNFRRFDREFAATNRLRTTGTDHLLAAARAAGVRRFIAQSYAGWPGDRGGPRIQSEEDPLDPRPPAAQRASLAAIRHVERVVPAAAPVEGIVLRYGALYGYGASGEYFAAVRKRRLPVVGDGAGVWSFLHVSDAASATAAAVQRGVPGVYNVVDDEPATVAEWLPYLAGCLGAKPPRRVPVSVGRLAAGEVGVSMMTQIRGCSNAKARRELGWRPDWPTWREGFARGLASPAPSRADVR